MINDREVLKQALKILRRLSDAALAREAVMGDPCRLFEAQAELRAAQRQADEFMREVGKQHPGEAWAMGFPEPPKDDS